MNVIFDSMGAQVQVQNETGNRLTTWTSQLQSAGDTVSFTDWQEPITGQLQGNDVLITTTHQWTTPPGVPPAIPQTTCFGYSHEDLGGIPSWVHKGGGLLLFVNHGKNLAKGPWWPVNDIQLAGALGITIVFAAIPLGKFTLAPSLDAPPAILSGVKTIEAVDSGGIVPGRGTVLVPLPAGSKDQSGLGYDTANLAFAVLYKFGKGKVIVLGHSGIAGNTGTNWPAPGQIGAGDNLQFLMNCVAYLGSGS